LHAAASQGPLTVARGRPPIFNSPLTEETVDCNAKVSFATHSEVPSAALQCSHSVVDLEQSLPHPHQRGCIYIDLIDLNCFSGGFRGIVYPFCCFVALPAVKLPREFAVAVACLGFYASESTRWWAVWSISPAKVEPETTAVGPLHFVPSLQDVQRPSNACCASVRADLVGYLNMQTSLLRFSATPICRKLVSQGQINNPAISATR
jgi:hypothetical protein